MRANLCVNVNMLKYIMHLPLLPQSFMNDCQGGIYIYFSHDAAESEEYCCCGCRLVGETLEQVFGKICQQTHERERDRCVRCSCLMYYCLIPSIRESLTTVHGVIMTDCLCECQRRQTAGNVTADTHSHTWHLQTDGKTHTSMMWVHWFPGKEEDGMWKETGDGPTQLLERWSN